MEREANESFVFYQSFLESIDLIEDEKIQLEIYKAITRYGIYGDEIELSPLAKAIFVLIKPQIDANNRRRKNSKSGGNPNFIKGQKNPYYEEEKENEKKEKEAEKEEEKKDNPKLANVENTITKITKDNHRLCKQDNQEITIGNDEEITIGNVDEITKTLPNVNVNANVNANVNVNANENVNVNANDSEKEKVKKKKEQTALEVIKEYGQEEDDDEIIKLLKEFVKMRNLKKKPLTGYAMQLRIKELNDLTRDKERQKKIINQTITSSWDRFYELKKQDFRRQNNQQRNNRVSYQDKKYTEEENRQMEEQLAKNLERLYAAQEEEIQFVTEAGNGI